MAGKVVFDAQTRDALVALCRDVFGKERDRQMEEVWLSKEDFLRQFGMFSEDWLKRYGHTLPRARVTITDEETGKVRCSQYAYARNETQRMIAENRLDFRIGDNGKVRGGLR